MAAEILKIAIEKGNEYRAIEENIYDTELYFYNTYKQARDKLGEIITISNSLEFIGRENRDSVSKLKDLPLQRLSEIARYRINNVISICANRGYGKTSAMLSFLRGIRAMHESDASEKYWKDSIAVGYKFEILETIDPTSMEKSDSLLKTVLSRMFARFTYEYEQRSYEARRSHKGIDSELRAEIEELFLKCFYCAEALHGEQQSLVGDLEDMYDHITEKGDGASLRTMIYQLILKYLDFLCDRESILIIPIDDADLNSNKVYELLEEIRKYLMLPHVVVLIAANMEQMECSVEQHFINAYQNSLKHKESMLDIARCHSFAERYLQKTIPVSHRIYLPDINNAVQNGFLGICVQYQKEGVDLLLDEKAKKNEETIKWNLQQQLLYFLHRKTGMLFLAADKNLHSILPDSMRDLTQFLAFFESLPDVQIGYDEVISAYIGDASEEIEKKLSSWMRNLENLLMYLVQMWAASNLQMPGRQLLQKLINQPKNRQIEFILRTLPEYYSNEQTLDSTTLSQKDYYEQFILACENKGVRMRAILDDQSGNSSTYADLTTVLGVLDDLLATRQQKKFAYAIHLYFSILFHQLLLRGIEDHEENYKITHILKDAFIREFSEGTDNIPIVYWRFSCEASKLKQALETKEKSNQTDNSTVCHFIRATSSSDRNTVRIAWDKVKDPEILTFHPLYVFLYEVDTLHEISKKKEIKSTYQSETPERIRILISLMVVLNWDVQSRLIQVLSTIPWEDKEKMGDSPMRLIFSRIPKALECLCVEYPILKTYVSDIKSNPFASFYDTSVIWKDGVIDLILLLAALAPAQRKINHTRYKEIIQQEKNYLNKYDLADFSDEVKETLDPNTNSANDKGQYLEGIFEYIYNLEYLMAEALDLRSMAFLFGVDKKCKEFDEAYENLTKELKDVEPLRDNGGEIVNHFLPEHLQKKTICNFLDEYSNYIDLLFGDENERDKEEYYKENRISEVNGENQTNYNIGILFNKVISCILQQNVEKWVRDELKKNLQIPKTDEVTQEEKN